MAKVKRYNLAGLSANVELGKQGSYIAANANVIGFYTSSDVLQQIEIANATLSAHAVTKAQMEAETQDLVQHISVPFNYNSANSNIANISAGARVISVTVDIPNAWGGTGDNTTSFVEVGDTNNSSRFIRAQDVDVLRAAQYHSQFQYEYTAGGVIRLTVHTGAATSGTGVVSVVLSGDTAVLQDAGSLAPVQTIEDLGNIG